MADYVKLAAELDKISDKLEMGGLVKEASEIDVIANTLDRMASLDIEAAKKKKKWIQKAISDETEGDFGAWCKRNGFDGVCQGCINKAAKKGGRAAKMALFAANVSKGKYNYPKQSDKD